MLDQPSLPAPLLLLGRGAPRPGLSAVLGLGQILGTVQGRLPHWRGGPPTLSALELKEILIKSETKLTLTGSHNWHTALCHVQVGDSGADCADTAVSRAVTVARPAAQKEWLL